jgi:hypothetical protein
VPAASDVQIYGIRHHGPGCARHLRAALEAFAPDCVLIEGPADAQGVLRLASDPGMRPPVALLVYDENAPKDAIFYPLAVFSPEWQALAYAFAVGAEARFIDLPHAMRLGAAETAAGDASERDPFDLLAEAAGFDDHENWWEDAIERRGAAQDLFAAIFETMRAVRGDEPPKDRVEALREAHMRQAIRAAEKEGFARIAVCCGAFHAPVLRERKSFKGDAEALRGLKKQKTVATWIPWTHGRMTLASGYGAGIHAPGWYHHLFTSPRSASAAWIAKATRLLRESDLDASSAGVIDALRLAEALATVRGRRTPSLVELNEAIQAVLVQGGAAPLALIRRRLELGEELGAVPAGTPAVPIVNDFEALTRSLRMKPSAVESVLDLDLREETGRGRSLLLHRLRVLDVPWGRPVESKRKTAGTFHEVWTLAWQPELSVRLVEADVHGQTVEAAANASLCRQSTEEKELDRLTSLLDQAIRAGLDAAAGALLSRVQEASAVAADVVRLARALSPLVRVARYGDVRGTRAEAVQPVIEGIVARLCVGLMPACASLDDDAAARMLAALRVVREDLVLIDRPHLVAAWASALRALAGANAHPLVAAGALRQAFDAGEVTEEEVSGRATLALGASVPAVKAAAWIEGLVSGGALALLAADGIWRAIDDWLGRLPPGPFVEVLPIVRRAFAAFTGPERRAMGTKAARLVRGGPVAHPAARAAATLDVDEARAARVVPILLRIVGTGFREQP